MTAAVPTSFIAHLSTAGGKESVVVGLSDIELESWGLHGKVPWMKLSSYISKETTTENQTVDGRTLIINWGSVPFVGYDNPWSDIPFNHPLKLKRGQWV
jgi:hypothetical protein